jgi:hypothetical protein
LTVKVWYGILVRYAPRRQVPCCRYTINLREKLLKLNLKKNIKMYINEPYGTY